MELLRSETLVKASAVFTSFRPQHGPPEGRGTCERLSGFSRVLGTTWASWSRDTCERLRGFHDALGTQHGPLGAEALAID